MRTEKNTFKWVVFIIAVMGVTIAAYHSVWTLDYVWDDRQLFIDSPDLRNPTNILESITTPVLSGTTYFRPLPLLTFIAEFSLFGPNATISHLINLLIHLVTSLLVIACAWKLLNAQIYERRLSGSIVSGVIYALHPALIEPIAWVSGRFDLMVAMFSAAAIAVAVYTKGLIRIVISCLFFMLAAFSKEMAATLPAIIMIMFWVASEGSDDFKYKNMARFVFEHWRFAISLVVTGVAYLYLRHWSLNGAVYHINVARIFEDSYDQIAYIGNTIVFYIKMTVWPFSNINPMHYFSMDMDAKSYIVAAIGWGFVFASLFARGNIYSRYKAYVVSYFISLLPVINVIPLTIGDNIGHERFLCLPLVLFSLLLGQVVLDLLDLGGKKRFFVLGALPAIVLLSILNITVTVPLWSNNIILWKWAFDKNEEDPYVQYSLISALVQQREFVLAEKIVNQVEATGQINNRLGVSIGFLKVRQQKYDEAKAIVRDSLNKVNITLPHTALSEEQLASGKYHLDERSRYLDVWFARSAFTVLSEANLGMRNFQKAKHQADIMIFYQNEYPPAHFLRALALYGLGDYEAADISYSKAEQLIVEHGKAELYELRRQFLSQVCEKNNKCLKQIDK